MNCKQRAGGPKYEEKRLSEASSGVLSKLLTASVRQGMQLAKIRALGFLPGEISTFISSKVRYYAAEVIFSG